MAKFIIGKKVGMTTIYDGAKGALNITLVECLPNKVETMRNEEKDGYNAVCLGLANKKGKILKREFRISSEDKANFEIGKEIGVDIFELDEKVIVSGITKGKGYQGVVKRHGFAGSPASHGHRHDHRAPGSIGCAFPEHVLKGKKMAGRMGGNKFTVKNLKVVYIDKEKNLIGLKGAVPGVVNRAVRLSVG
ncbi:MAG: 50S ribosomal protein L3 [Candidatus Moranbacteria bacterium GW2011_GWE1_35_17]|nr:MAG: 50S ribosomal protein L3 [Candidatus Moranbacteria bacterium GW2011_GWE1_35_17]KKP83797.1 MAG: 50S ribosomal protein L3 [Candidatus Moranbacteria bacterium GW2011_GWF1_35_5]KKP84741.1 MAG: 50S ribosomal protein L3 [Candidatus Moranbacteria bacterium GW2011_GWF2_35_54]